MTTDSHPEASEDKPKVRLGILISGRGSNCMAIAHAIAEGHLTGCEIGVIVSNIPGAPGVETAKAFGVPVITLEGRGREQRDHEEAISALLRKFRIDLVCMAGYRRTLSAGFLREWRNRILNIQPSLLPSFPGHHAAQQALDFGAQFTGCTVYFVDERDTGPIVLQGIVPIHDEDEEADVFDRLLPEQHIAYIEAIRRVVSGEYEVQGKRYLRKLSPMPYVDVEIEEPFIGLD
jgi:phosphoribosylglycinamide formyltransferase-1